MLPHQTAFLELALEHEVLKFGQFTLKSGRSSPYFFNLGKISSGAAMARLARAYAQALRLAGLEFDMLFGPAYKGIPLATAVAYALSEQGRDVPYAYNRKEAKDHGEGGSLVGAKLHGRVVIIDDVISAGTSVRESVAMIRAAGAEPCGVAIALDRQERATETTQDGVRDADHSAVQFVQRELGLAVCAIATLSDLLQYLARQADPALAQHLPRVQAYRDRYGV